MLTHFSPPAAAAAAAAAEEDTSHSKQARGRAGVATDGEQASAGGAKALPRGEPRPIPSAARAFCRRRQKEEQEEQEEHVQEAQEGRHGKV